MTHLDMLINISDEPDMINDTFGHVDQYGCRKMKGHSGIDSGNNET